MNDEQTLQKCELDMQECLADMGNQQTLLAKLRTQGGYDSFALAEAMDKIGKLRDRLDGIHGQLNELSKRPRKK
jgi:hypothetical protein